MHIITNTDQTISNNNPQIEIEIVDIVIGDKLIEL